MKELTKEWIDKAEGDFIVVNHEYDAKTPVYDAICFHAQQCVEKYMKAILQENNIKFEKVHDLDLLLEKCKHFAPLLEERKEELIELSSFAVEIRYPGITAAEEEAANCISIMAGTRKIIKEYFEE
ncbi:MAG: HEPN domain-containing protein [Methanosarcinales archaeon]|uniref:HEPN domain-containing protein n=1 Tax=Candidatus Ethanoperedens thermophilum TaxID=2766897 RepID=A0A848DB01_9EURY|nr:HEPN domain-containing protein [Candidatus Ethanoperedens thermophilum]